MEEDTAKSLAEIERKWEHFNQNSLSSKETSKDFQRDSTAS
jgi:hypothetical protein